MNAPPAAEQQQDTIKEILLYSLVIMIVVLAAALLRSTGISAPNITCYRMIPGGQAIIPCTEVLRPGDPHYIPRLNETEINKSMQEFWEAVHG